MPCLAVMLRMSKRQGNYQRKWDTESCKEFIEENNIDVELLSEYIDMNTKMDFRCSCGDVFSASWHEFNNKKFPKRQCNKCGRHKGKAVRQKITCETIRVYLKENGYTCKLISDKYINCDSKLEFECECGNHFFASWSNIKKMSGLCKECVAKIKSNIMIQRFSEDSIVLKKYDTHLHTTINIDSTYTYNYIQNKIDLVYGDNQFELLNINGEYLTIRHMLCGNEFTIRKDHFLYDKQGCRYCNKEHRDFGALSQEEFINRVSKYMDDFEFLSDYVNQNQPVKIKHKKCGNILYKSPVKIWDRGIYCPYCSGTKGEQYISSYLDIHNISYMPQYSFDDCVAKRKLSFDFYLPDCNVCIEYQGQQHYHPIEIFGGQDAFDSQMKNDEIKRDYCKANNISLIEISYEDYNNIDYILDSYFGMNKEVVQ